MASEILRIDRLRDFVRAMTELVARAGDDEGSVLEAGGRWLADLVGRDDWLPASFAQPHPEHYQQYLLHCDPLERFSVVSFVWAPGQRTPIHDHTVWGMIGQLRGAERATSYRVSPGGLERGESTLYRPGDLAKVSPAIGDVHKVANARADGTSISIHVYGANIGAVARHVFDPASGAAKDFVSGYAAGVVPNLWDRSDETARARD